MALKKGDVVNGYRIVTTPTMSGGSRGQWCFVEKGGSQFFMKAFLDPKYPGDADPGSAATKAARREQCRIFVERQNDVIDRIRGKVAPGGNLIYPQKFFLQGSQYYKITDKIDAASLRPSDIFKLPEETKLLILKTIANSLAILHRTGVVHGDLKIENLIIKEVRPGQFVAKLIDFDDAYISGRPPGRDQLVGDFAYYSPEASRYIQGDAATTGEHLTVAADIFALGLIFAECTTGSKPSWDGDADYACDAVNDGKALRLNAAHRLNPLVISMLSKEPSDRPTATQLLGALKSPAHSIATTFAPAPPAPAAVSSPRLKENSFVRTMRDRRDAAGSPAPGAPPSPASAPASPRLKSTFKRKD